MEGRDENTGSFAQEVYSKQLSPDERTVAPTGVTRGSSYDYDEGDRVIETGSVRSSKPYACADCRYATDRKNNLRRHRATMHERCERALECCGLTFVSKSELREHVTERHGAGAGYACAECGRRFGRRALMRRHAVIHDPANGGGGGSRDGGGSGRPSSGGQRRRSSGVISIGRRLFACSECDYTSGHKSNIDRHLHRHVAGLSWLTAPTVGVNGRYDNQPSAIGHREVGVPRTGCRCNMCLGTLHFRYQLLPALPPSTTSLSPQLPMFNFLPSRLGDVSQNFRNDVDVRHLWSVDVSRYGPSMETATDVGNLAEQPLTWMNGHNRIEMNEELPMVDWPPASTTSTMAGDDASGSSDAAGDVTSTCYRRQRRRLRLLPLLHTCRSCSLTFVSQLQLKYHSDLFHRATELEVAVTRPICCRVKQPGASRL